MKKIMHLLVVLLTVATLNVDVYDLSADNSYETCEIVHIQNDMLLLYDFKLNTLIVK